ncbi:UPF0187 protein [Seminavis robusta]|uniref:UPF0187 protein n=1 Tax=Seminavis robusta TaxID=568900 RepID=A0A9N8DLS8_9STRA|nr:UPF0187 protein [Seminavis robusta]|eukprot:Sro152_g069350.1 UPF0187 protein (425) ;mRNA; r:10185-11640
MKLFVFATLLGLTQGFVTPSTSMTSKSLTKLSVEEAPVSTGFDNFCIENVGGVKIDPEYARRYRRTVYTHDDWKKHRQQDRFLIYMGSLFSSGVYQNMKSEVFFVTSFAAIVCVWNALVTGPTGIDGTQMDPIIGGGILPAAGLPLNPFTLSGSSLALLLTFRVNTSYKRWDEARKNWGMNINHTRDLVRMANTFYDTGIPDFDPQTRQETLNYVALCTWSFVRAMKRHLSPEEEDEQAFRIEIMEKLPGEQAQKIIDAAHRPNRALQDLSYAIEQVPMHFVRRNQVQEALTIFEDNLGSSERLLTSPVPLFYTRHLSRFITIWLALLPLAIYDPFKGSWNHIAMVPAMFFLSIFFFGVEELATQLEEPFTILPMQGFCDKIYNWCFEIMSWQPGDGGRMPKPVKPQHKYFVAVPAPQEFYQQY